MGTRVHWSHEKWQTVLTAMLVFIGTVYTIAAVLQWRSMSKQLDVMKKQIESEKSARSADFVLRLDELFNREPLLRIRYAIIDEKPVLKEHGGEFEANELDRYLDLYETLNDVYSGGLLSEDIILSAYSYWIEKTYDNAEIQDYLKRLRKDDPEFYSGFKQLRNSISSTPAKRP